MIIKFICEGKEVGDWDSYVPKPGTAIVLAKVRTNEEFYKCVKVMGVTDGIMYYEVVPVIDKSEE